MNMGMNTAKASGRARNFNRLKVTLFAASEMQKARKKRAFCVTLQSNCYMQGIKGACGLLQ